MSPMLELRKSGKDRKIKIISNLGKMSKRYTF